MKERKRTKLKHEFNKVLDFKLPMLIVMIILTVLLATFDTKADTVRDSCTFNKNLTEDQLSVARIAYLKGSEHGIGYTTVAIAWKESRLGVYNVRYNVGNINDQSFGVMHTVAKWKVADLPPFEAGLWVNKMIKNPLFSIEQGVLDILYWNRRAKGNWFKGVGMYNGGYKGNTAYANSIVNIINELKGCKF